MKIKRPFALSIAGFDPSGGAGVTADLKTFEALRVQGLGVCTALTYQNDGEFDGLEWVPLPQLKLQLEPLLRRYKVEVVKIGLVQNLAVLEELVVLLRQYRPDIPVVWDPILKASAGFTFHEQVDRQQLEALCQQLFLVTPNWLEIEQLISGVAAPEGAAFLSQHCHVLLKGGHNDDKKGYDYLYSNGESQAFRPRQVAAHPKHGSGCVLSAAIAAQVAHGYALPKACLRAKTYVSRFLNSNPLLLGYHKF